MGKGEAGSGLIRMSVRNLLELKAGFSWLPTVCVCVCVCVYTQVRMGVGICVYLCQYICVCVCVCTGMNGMIYM